MIVAVLVLDCRKEFVDSWVEVEDFLFVVEVFACDLLDYEVSLDLVIVLFEDLFSYSLD